MQRLKGAFPYSGLGYTKYQLLFFLVAQKLPHPNYLMRQDGVCYPVVAYKHQAMCLGGELKSNPAIFTLF